MNEDGDCKFEGTFISMFTDIKNSLTKNTISTLLYNITTQFFSFIALGVVNIDFHWVFFYNALNLNLKVYVSLVCVIVKQNTYQSKQLFHVPK